MIEILVETTIEEAGCASIGEFSPPDIPAALFLLEKYGVLDANGCVGKVNRIIYDVGFHPGMWVSIDYS